MDANKLLIIEELYQNSLQSVNKLAQKLPLARQTITKITQELWNDQIIAAPTIVFNPNRIRMHVFFVELSGNPTNPEILKKFLPIPEIESMDLILGDSSLMIQFIVFTQGTIRNYQLDLIRERRNHGNWK